MAEDQFIIKVLDLYWVDGTKDNQEDLCLHGDVYVKIGDEIVADGYSCTVSSTALYLLKSIDNDYLIGENPTQLLPCCGHFIIPSDNTDTVEISGCPVGHDWTVLHLDNSVTLITSEEEEVTIKSDLYREIVYSFVDEIEEFYKKCTPKNIPIDEFDKDGYLKFWKEWRHRRNRKD